MQTDPVQPEINDDDVALRKAKNQAGVATRAGLLLITFPHQAPIQPLIGCASFGSVALFLPLLQSYLASWPQKKNLQPPCPWCRDNSKIELGRGNEHGKVKNSISFCREELHTHLALKITQKYIFNDQLFKKSISEII